MRSFLIPIVMLYGVFAAAAAVGDPTAKPDPRLTQRVSIECANVRLHTALEQISNAGSVVVRAGKSKDDWGTRDVPVLICASDMRLGELLQDTAAVTHLMLSRYSQGQGQPSYRIWRDLKHEKILSDYFDSVEAAEAAIAQYDWDVWSSLKDVPDSEFKSRSNEDSTTRVRNEYKDLSRIFASLGNDTRDRILDGDLVNIGVKTSSGIVQESLRKCLQSNWKGISASPDRRPMPEEMPQADLDKSALMVSFRQDVMEGEKSLKIYLWIGGQGIHSYDSDSAYSVLRQDKYKLPTRPKMPAQPTTFELPAGYVRLDVSEGSSSPLLSRKVKLVPPKDKKDPTYAHALAALSKASDISIVCEDFESYTVGTVLSRVPELAGLFGRDITVGEVLRFAWRMDWRVNEGGTVIAGATTGWAVHHKNLVAEDVIQGLETRLNAAGVGLDDLQPLSELTRGQCQEWVYPSPKLRMLRSCASTLARGSLWRIYFGLSPADRADAKSASGLSLAKLDREWLARIFKLRSQARQGMVIANDRSLSAHSAADDACSDPNTLPDLILRVEKQQWQKKCGYIISVEGEKIDMRDSLGPFPIYSEQREAELSKAASPGKQVK